MVNPLGRCHVGNELAIPRRRPAMAEPNHPVAVARALPYGLFSGSQPFGFWIRPVVNRFVTPSSDPPDTGVPRVNRRDLREPGRGLGSKPLGTKRERVPGGVSGSSYPYGGVRSSWCR